jgi:hypothetical protein
MREPARLGHWLAQFSVDLTPQVRYKASEQCPMAWPWENLPIASPLSKEKTMNNRSLLKAIGSRAVPLAFSLSLIADEGPPPLLQLAFPGAPVAQMASQGPSLRP